jgi:hypothetical protein
MRSVIAASIAAAVPSLGTLLSLEGSLLAKNFAGNAVSVEFGAAWAEDPKSKATKVAALENIVQSSLRYLRFVIFTIGRVLRSR